MFGFKYNQKWIRKLIGMEVTQEQYQRFKDAAKIKSKYGKSKPKKSRRLVHKVKIPDAFKQRLNALVEELTKIGVDQKQISSYINSCRGIIPADGTLSVAQLKRLNYRTEYLYTAHWRRIRGMVLSRDEYRCLHCYTDQNLTVHHKSYRNLGHEQDCLDDLLTLCEPCHKKTHGL